MVDSCRVFTYSSNNKYANDYYNACRHFDDIRNKVIRYEQSSSDRDCAKYQKMMEEFKYWDNKVPETSNKAGAEEDRIAQSERNKENAVTNPMIGNNINYYA